MAGLFVTRVLTCGESGARTCALFFKIPMLLWNATCRFLNIMEWCRQCGVKLLCLPLPARFMALKPGSRFLSITHGPSGVLFAPRNCPMTNGAYLCALSVCPQRAAIFLRFMDPGGDGFGLFLPSPGR
jgi:hypothetical protein